MIHDDADRLAEYLTEALALAAAYLRRDYPAVLDLLGTLHTREDVLCRYTALAQMVAVSTEQHGSEDNLQATLLGLQIDPTGDASCS